MKSLDKNKTNKAEWEKYKVKGDWRVNGFVFDHYVIPECELPHLLSSERQRLIEKIEGMILPHEPGEITTGYYNEAIKDVILEIKKL